MDIVGICTSNETTHLAMSPLEGCERFSFVPIHLSIFNHSCSPNITRKCVKSGEIFVRTIKKIKAGEEINFCYLESACIMREKQVRQKYLKDCANIICACNFCKDGKEDIEAFQAFEKFNQDAKGFKARLMEMVNNRQDPTEIIPFLKKEIQCLKNMYKLGKKKKAAVSLLYKTIL